MADIFISYAREDEKRLRELVQALEEKGWSIFWDRRIPAGKTWQSYIGKALAEARCVIVGWSHHSITSEWVIEEANDAKGRGVLVPVLLDSVQPPLGFRGIQAADLTEWKPGDPSPHLDQLIQDITGVLGAKPPYEPAPPKHELSETRPHEPAPIKLKSFTSKKRPTFLIAAGVALALAIVVGSALWFTLRLPRPPESKPIEPQVIKTPEVRQEAQKASTPAVKTPEPQVVQKKPAAAAPKPKPIEPQVIKTPEVRQEAQKASTAAVKTPEPQVKTATEAPTKRTSINSIGMSFVLIPAGTFTMGSPTGEPERESDEREHPVTISKSFYLQTTEVTQKQWMQVMGSNPSYFKDCGNDCPVEQISWDDAQEFIRKLNQREGGKGYRLPTEAEWEYACRAGTSTSFSTGRCISTNQANYNGNSPLSGCPKGVDRKRPLPVASFPANPWGLYDMHGNVWEWCQDWHGDYPTGHVTDPTGPASGKYRVLRGGSWSYDAGHIRSAYRYWGEPDYRHLSLGFRLARDS